ncbi:MAG TPA: hypothetical protein DD435_12160 [Cyanobacteria bacterium UBA8530]|nr:hypothetical protein [Cyanobacteria bacterium UBA8530]
MDIRLDGTNPLLPKINIKPLVEKPKKALTAKLQGDSLKLSGTYIPPAESTWYKVKRKVALELTGVNVEHSRALTKEMADTVLPQMKPGDLLLRRTDYGSANMAIPGFYGHAAVYVGDGTIIDATTHGVRKISVQDFFAEGDHAMVIRPKAMTEENADKTVKFLEQQVGKVYDYDLDDDNNDRFTCTELASKAMQAGLGKNVAEKNIFGATNPDGFRNENFDLVWGSNPDETSLGK